MSITNERGIFYLEQPVHLSQFLLEDNELTASAHPSQGEVPHLAE